jgi:hypothetical protein
LRTPASTGTPVILSNICCLSNSVWMKNLHRLAKSILRNRSNYLCTYDLYGPVRKSQLNASGVWSQSNDSYPPYTLSGLLTPIRYSWIRLQILNPSLRE